MKYIHRAERIFAKDKEGHLLAEITFPKRDEHRTDINHVFVDESLRGQGIASELMLLAYETIKKQKKQIVAKCPYAIDWFKKHPEYQDIVINVKTQKTT
ncbi:MAG: GNAT family N-acetyltransferase [Candidatus Izemoplasmatales bacterium]|jgi:predicted GNAT family acetyltransferase|nr:GNAT family N-acetyltransferase [Candidatus Izemoplasmatales bacterium]